MDIIIGLDMSLRNTGMCIMRREKKNGYVQLVLSYTNCFSTIPPKTGSHILDIEREIRNISWLKTAIDTEIGRFTHNYSEEDHLIVELPDRSQSHKSSFSMGVCHSIAAMLHDERGIEVVTMKALKLWSGSKKGDKKSKVEEKVLQEFPNLETRNDNIIDAIGLCLMKCDELSVLGL